MALLTLKSSQEPETLLISTMTSVGPPDIPAEESQALQDPSLATPSSNVEDLTSIHWTVDLGEELTVGDIADYIDAFKKVVNTGELLGLMAAQDGAPAEVFLGQTVVQYLHYGSPLSIILSAPKQLAEGIVDILSFVISIPANVSERWSKARILKHIRREIEAGRITLTNEQVLTLILSADHKAMQTLASSGHNAAYTTTGS